jgi:hypothetical protein
MTNANNKQCAMCKSNELSDTDKYCAYCNDYVEKLKKALPPVEDSTVEEFIALFNKHNKDEVDRAKLKELEDRVEYLEKTLMKVWGIPDKNILKD